MIIFQRRLRDEKVLKDREAAIDVLKALIDKGEAREIRKIMKALPMKWQKKIEDGLKIAADKEVTKALLMT